MRAISSVAIDWLINWLHKSVKLIHKALSAQSIRSKVYVFLLAFSMKISQRDEGRESFSKSSFKSSKPGRSWDTDNGSILEIDYSRSK